MYYGGKKRFEFPSNPHGSNIFDHDDDLESKQQQQPQQVNVGLR